MDGLDQSAPLGDAHEPRSDDHARRSAAVIEHAEQLRWLAKALQVWATDGRGPLSEEAARLAIQLERELWEQLGREAEQAAVQVRPARR